LILLIFFQIYSMFNNSHTIGLKSKHYKTPLMHPTHGELFNDTKCMTGNCVLGDLSMRNKTNKLRSLIDQYTSHSSFVMGQICPRSCPDCNEGREKSYGGIGINSPQINKSYVSRFMANVCMNDLFLLEFWLFLEIIE
jgi:hypothetical protein